MITAWRIVKRKHVRAAFSGEGARRFGGRWNTPGKPLVYLAGSQSLAVLEMLAHLDRADLLGSYALIEARADDELVEAVDVSKLPRNWRLYPPSRRVQAVGDEWLRTGSRPVLRVPSVIIPTEPNFLVNPAHADFARIAISAPVPYRFDSRLT